MSLTVQSLRRSWLVHHVMCTTAYVTTIINDVMELAVLVQHLSLKEAPRDHSNNSSSSVANCCKSHYSEIVKAVISYMSIDSNFQVKLRFNSAPRMPNSSRVYNYILSYTLYLFQLLLTPL